MNPRLLLISVLTGLWLLILPPRLAASHEAQMRPLSEVLDHISEMYHVIFTYDVNTVAEISVDVHFKSEEKLETVVNRVLKPTGLRYKHLGEKYYIIFKDTRQGNRTARKLSKSLRRIQELENSQDITLQQSGSETENRFTEILAARKLIPLEKTISGSVKDSEGNPLYGATVRAKSANQGTLTTNQGRFELTVSDNVDTLVVSYIGYTTQVIAIGDLTEIEVIMEPNDAALEEIVVIGYGAAKKSDVTGSVVSVGAKEISEVPVSNVGSALQGRAAGIQVQQTSSRPGGGTQIRIRGNRSLGSDESGVNSPLVVLDGIPYSGSINDIPPNSIVSIDVLKDASATAIYGSRGANGVIIITTQRGRTGEARLSYNGYFGIGSVIDHYDVFNAEEYADLKQASNFGEDGGFFTADEQQSMIEGRSTNWQELMYKPSYITNHELGVNGGTEMTQYAISGSFFEETAVLPGQKFSRFSLRTALDQRINSRIKVGLTSLNSLTLTNGENANPMFQILTLSPLYQAYNPDGTVNELPAVGSVDDNTRNPLLLYRENSWAQQRRRLRTFNSLYGEVKILPSLTYKLNVGLDYWQDEYGEFLGENTPFRNGNGNTAAVRNEDTWSYTIENLLTFDQNFGDHSLNVVGLFSAQEQENNRSGMNAQAVFADFLQYYNFSLAEVTTVPDNVFAYSRWGLLSGMTRINYGYQDRFLVTLTARADGSSRLSDGNKWFAYPAGAVAWNIANENFMSNQQIFNTLKLRAGYGRTSNQAVAPYSSLGRLGRTTYNFGADNGVFGFLVTNLPNTNLRWEFTTSANLGIDFGLFNDRFTGTIDLYRNETDNVLQSRNLPVTSGVPGSFQENIGRTMGQGVEVMLSSDIIRPTTLNGFRWELDLNFAAHQERILELAEGVQQDVGNGWFVDQPVNVIYDYEKIGIWQLDEAAEAAELGDFEPGDIKVRDLNEDGVIDDEDRRVLGQLDPKFTLGGTTRLTYKGFDLSAVAFGQVGGNLVSTLYQMNQVGPFNSLEGRRNGPDVDYWTEDNPTNEFPETGNQITRFGSVMGYFDGSFLKIRTINLGYTFQQSLLDRIRVRTARVYFTVNNPFQAFFSEYVRQGGVDPEPNGRGTPGSGFTPGFGRRLSVGANTPPSRSFIIGLNLGL